MTRRQLVLHLLREAGDRGVTTSEFLQGGGGSRFGGRLLELRAEGHVIETERIHDGAFRYTLTHDVERGAGAPGSTHAPESAGMATTPTAGASLSVEQPSEPPLFDLPSDYRDAA